MKRELFWKNRLKNNKMGGSNFAYSLNHAKTEKMKNMSAFDIVGVND